MSGARVNPDATSPSERAGTAFDSLAAALLDSSPDGLLLVDRDGAITLANPAAAAIFGRPRDELVGASVESLVPAEQRAQHVEHRHRYNDAPVARPMGSALRLLAEHADGTLFPVEISLSPIELDELQFIATVRDVSQRQAARARISLHEERERIARDLHDLVIQQLFAAGMSLDAIATQVTPPETSARLTSITEQLDDTITEIRRAIFRLGQPETDIDPAARVLEIAQDHVGQLGFEPALDIHGELDAISPGASDQLAATLTESLSNVIRHAHATSVDITLRVDERMLCLTVADNGVGVSGDAKHLGGLSNMTWRAEQFGGSCTIEAVGPQGGTVVTWSVPRHAVTGTTHPA